MAIIALHRYPLNSQLDHSFHEFESLTYTPEIEAHQTVVHFIDLLKEV